MFCKGSRKAVPDLLNDVLTDFNDRFEHRQELLARIC